MEPFLIVCLLPTVLGFAVPQAGAAPRMATGNLNPEVAQLIEEVPSKDQYLEAGAVILLKEGMVSVDKNGVFSLTIHVVGRILDEKARSDYGQIFTGFNSYYYGATLDFAHTIKNDGTVIGVAEDAVQVTTPPNPLGLKGYTDIRLLTFSLPALEPEAAFEYQVTIKQNRFVIENAWGAYFAFNYVLRVLGTGGIPRIDPVYKSRFVLKVREGEQFTHAVRRIEVSPTIKRENGTVIYNWEVQDLPAVPIEEMMPPIREILPEIQVSSLQGWNEIDEWANKLFRPKSEVTREIRAKTEELIREPRTETEKIGAIFYFIQRRVEYLITDLNRGGYTPHAANEVLKKRYGECKDRVMLLIAMLKAAGITAYPALTTLFPQNEINRDFPYLTGFTHLIVYIPREAGDLWLDSTSPVTPFPSLHWSAQDRWALIIDGNGGKLLKTPSSKPEDNLGTVTIGFHFKDGTLEAKMSMEGRGAFSDNLKSLLKSMQMRQQKQLFRTIVEAKFPNAQFRTLEFSDLSDPRVSFNAMALIEPQLRGETLKTLQTFLYGNSVKPMLAFFTMLHQLSPPESRTHDLRLGFKFHLLNEEIYPPPTEEFVPAPLPLDESRDTRLLSTHKQYMREGESVKVRWELMLKQNTIRREEYKELYDSMREVLKTSEWLVAFSRGKVDEKEAALEQAVKERPRDAKGLLNLARHYLTKAKYEEAKELLEKAVTIDARNGEIHYFLGIAFSYVDQYEQAQEAFKTAKELGYKP